MPASLPSLPSLGLELPQSDIINAALAFVREHCNELTYNHVVRSAYWSAIIAKNDASFSGRPLDLELVVLSCILHDMGWAESKHLLSADKRFEVDGANIARDFIHQFNADRGGGDAWDRTRVQRCWDAIALHTTFSIARHAAAEVSAVACGVLADFLGPHFPPGGPGGGHQDKPITTEAYHAVMRLFPRAGFTGTGLTEVMCGICRDKAATTYDNFAGDFGERFGVDGAGAGAAAFGRARRDGNVADLLLGGLEALEALDASRQDE